VRAPEGALRAQATIAGGGVIPHIHKSLINKTQVRAQRNDCLASAAVQRTHAGLCKECTVRC